MKNRTISDEQLRNMTLEDIISSIYFSQLFTSREESELIVGHMLKISMRLMRLFNLSTEETLTRVPDSGFDERIMENVRKDLPSDFESSDMNDQYQEILYRIITCELQTEREMGRCSLQPIQPVQK